LGEYEHCLDYYRIKRDNEIVQADQGPVIGDLPTMESRPVRNGPARCRNSILFYDENGDLATIAAPYVNANKTNTDGIDLDLRHRFEVDGIGNFTAGLIGRACSASSRAAGRRGSSNTWVRSVCA
jgi:iron complex outermembrane receptor protein